MPLFLIASLAILLSLGPAGMPGVAAPNPDNPDTILRVGIVRRLDKELTVEPAHNEDSLVVEYPDTPASDKLTETAELAGLKVERQRLQATAPVSQPAIMIAGTHRTYENAYHHAIDLEKLFPDQDWKLYFPGSWEIRTESDDPQQLLQKLAEAGYEAAWKREELTSQEFLSWVSEDGYRYNRRHLRISTSSGRPLRVGKRVYPGSLELLQDSFGTYTVVNEVPLEQYLRGVVPFEIGADAANEAIKAQAVLARTYALANRDRFQPDNYELCADQNCQVYRGLNATNPRIDRAIRQTAGEVLVNAATGEFAQVFYHSADGGHSASYSDIWPSHGQAIFAELEGINTCFDLPRQFDLALERDAREFLTSPQALNWGCLDASSSRFRWRREIKGSELVERMHEAADKWSFAWPSFEDVYGLLVTSRSDSGRVIKLRVDTDGGSFYLTRDSIRAALGGLPSTFFVTDTFAGETRDDKVFAFSGGGFGHGVGLSQYGARTMARGGYSYRDILSVYLPNYELRDSQ